MISAKTTYYVFLNSVKYCLPNYPFFFHLTDEPKWRPGLKNQFYGFISGTSNLTCEAIAEPPATFIWYNKRGQPIREGMILTEDSKSTLVVRRNSHLYYNCVKIANFWTFRCFHVKKKSCKKDIFYSVSQKLQKL